MAKPIPDKLPYFLPLSASWCFLPLKLSQGYFCDFEALTLLSMFKPFPLVKKLCPATVAVPLATISWCLTL